MSMVLASMDAFFASDEHPSILSSTRDPADFRRRARYMLMDAEALRFASLRKLHQKAMQRPDPRSQLYHLLDPNDGIFGSGNTGKGAAASGGGGGMRQGWGGSRVAKPAKPAKAKARAAKPDPRRPQKEPVVKEEVVQVSRTGRTVKTPSKFKEERRHHPYGRMLSMGSPTGAQRSGGAASGASRSGVRKPRAPKGADDDDDDDGGVFAGPVDTGSRIGETYQAGDLPVPTSGPSTSDRGDELLWSPEVVGAAGKGAALLSYLAEALPLVGGAPQNPPTSTSAQEHFPTELALMALHQAAGDTQTALDILREYEDREWTKVEERQFRSALTKHKGDIFAIRDAVRTKSLAAVVRFYFVEDGFRKKEETDRKRELQRLSRGGGKDGKDGKNDSGAAGAGGGSSSSAVRDGAETPFSAADSAPRSDLEADAMSHFSD